MKQNWNKSGELCLSFLVLSCKSSFTGMFGKCSIKWKPSLHCLDSLSKEWIWCRYPKHGSSNMSQRKRGSWENLNALRVSKIYQDDTSWKRGLRCTTTHEATTWINWLCVCYVIGSCMLSIRIIFLFTAWMLAHYKISTTGKSMLPYATAICDPGNRPKQNR